MGDTSETETIEFEIEVIDSESPENTDGDQDDLDNGSLNSEIDQPDAISSNTDFDQPLPPNIANQVIGEKVSPEELQEDNDKKLPEEKLPSTQDDQASFKSVTPAEILEETGSSNEEVKIEKKENQTPIDEQEQYSNAQSNLVCEVEEPLIRNDLDSERVPVDVLISDLGINSGQIEEVKSEKLAKTYSEAGEVVNPIILEETAQNDLNLGLDEEVKLTQEIQQPEVTVEITQCPIETFILLEGASEVETEPDREQVICEVTVESHTEDFGNIDLEVFTAEHPQDGPSVETYRESKDIDKSKGSSEDLDSLPLAEQEQKDDTNLEDDTKQEQRQVPQEESKTETDRGLIIDSSAARYTDQDVVTTPKSQSASSDGQNADDLERELECEPAFERRQVILKRDSNPREDYELGEELGRGKFGTVYRCKERTSGLQLAAKFVHMRRQEDRIDVEREIEIMSILQHKRLLQLYDAYDDGGNEMCLITELVEGGELFERIVDDDFHLTERKAAIFMRQICEGVEYMHEQRIVHLDMKPENILCVSRTGNRIKLIDFGLARKLDSSEPLRVMFGTPDFAAPEVLSYDIVSLATDMWSVGVICYVLLSGLSPFMGDNDMETMANVTKATYDFDDEAFEPISDMAKDFIAKLLVRDQTSRLSPVQCLKHPWLAKRSASSRRSSLATISTTIQHFGKPEFKMPTMDELGESEDEEVEPSLSKRNLKKYVIRRKWHKTVHAIMALGRMGASLRLNLKVEN